MEHSVTPLPSALGEGEANRVGSHPTHVDADADADANKQRRKVQNRKNKRAQRLRIREQDPVSVLTHRPFQVRRWRLDELDGYPSRDASSAKGATATYISPGPPHTHREGRFDHWELLQDLIGELMSVTPAPKRRDTPLTITVADPKTMWTLPLTARRDEDEVTAGRRGLIVWGEPYDMQSWEATPGFLAKWAWAVEGCDELVKCSNRWRMMRGEEPMRLSES
ncbi:hypothetical protein ACJZ2D_015216 [Fusarium nematophilum]